MMLPQLVEQRERLMEAAAKIDAELKAIDDHINATLGPRINEVREATGKLTGTVTVLIDGFEVKQTVAKKVTWDQAKMEEIINKIASAGDDPKQWVKVEYKVGEREYKAWPAPVKAVFDPARTVTPGSARIDIKEATV